MYIYRESRIVCCGSQGSKGYQKSWVKTCATSGSGTGTGNAFHSLLITTMGESRQSAIGCNRKNMLTHSPQKPQSTTPLPLSLLRFPSSSSFSFIYGCNYRLDLQLFYVRQNTSLNLYDKFPVQSANQTRWMSHCLPLSLLFSLSPSPISLYHCLTVHHERILSNNNRSMSIIIIL